MPSLHTIAASTKPGRVGLAGGTWMHQAADAAPMLDALARWTYALRPLRG
jgi:hypothetical protein